MAAVMAPLIGSGVNLATNLYLQSQQKDNTQAMMDAADPFRGQRGQYQGQLQELMNGNFSPSNPAYNFRMQQGTDATNRGAAASGQTGSGAQMAQLQQVGQQTASQEYDAQFKRLADLAGVNAGSPATAAGVMSHQQDIQNQGFGKIAGFMGQAAQAGVGAWNGTPNAPQPDYGNTNGLVSSSTNISSDGSMTSTNYNYDQPQVDPLAQYYNRNQA